MAQRPGFVRNVDLHSFGSSLSATFEAPRYGEEPDRFIVALRDMEGNRIDGSRQVIQADAPLEVRYDDLEEGKTYKIGFRARAGVARGRWLYYMVTVGSDVAPYNPKFYMYFVEAGEPTPVDAVGEPTRHVRLYEDGWRRYDPIQAYVAVDTWWHFSEVTLGEERLDAAKTAVDDWMEDNPDVENQMLGFKLLFAEKELEAARANWQKAEAAARAEAEAKYPPENLTQEDGRWVERPRR